MRPRRRRRRRRRADVFAGRPKLKAWYEHMQGDEAGRRVFEEVHTALQGWDASGRWEKVRCPPPPPAAMDACPRPQRPPWTRLPRRLSSLTRPARGHAPGLGAVEQLGIDAQVADKSYKWAH